MCCSPKHRASGACVPCCCTLQLALHPVHCCAPVWQPAPRWQLHWTCSHTRRCHASSGGAHCQIGLWALWLYTATPPESMYSLVLLAHLTGVTGPALADLSLPGALECSLALLRGQPTSGCAIAIRETIVSHHMMLAAPAASCSPPGLGSILLVTLWGTDGGTSSLCQPASPSCGQRLQHRLQPPAWRRDSN